MRDTTKPPPIMSATLSPSELSGEFNKIKSSFFGHWDDGPDAQNERLGFGIQILTRLRYEHKRAMARDQRYHAPLLSFTEMWELYHYVVKANNQSVYTLDFFDEERVGLIYQALKTLKPAVRLNQIKTIADAFSGRIDEILLMLSFIPEIGDKRDHPAYLSLMDEICHAQRDPRASAEGLDHLFEEAERVYRSLSEDGHRDFFEPRGSHMALNV